MAGLGRKVFAAGEILTAADLQGYAVDQSVMVFADSTARSSAIPSPSEGMVTFREDQDVVEVFDGAAFKTVGGLVDVKSALFTGTQSAAVTAGDNLSVTDLSITHEVADASNKLIISAFLGVAASSFGFGNVGLAVHDGTSLIAVGDAVGTKTRLTAGGFVSDSQATFVATMPSVTFVHTPGAGSKTYTVRAINISDATRTLFINRRETELDSELDSRGVSSLVIQEVAV